MCAIAQQLQLASGTVKSYLARARQKLGCRNVRELTTLLLREGLVGPEELLDPREEHAEEVGETSVSPRFAIDRGSIT